MKDIGRELQEEALKIGIKKPRKIREKKPLIKMQKKILPPDIEEDAVKVKEQRMIGILVKFLEKSKI